MVLVLTEKNLDMFNLFYPKCSKNISNSLIIIFSNNWVDIYQDFDKGDSEGTIFIADRHNWLNNGFISCENLSRMLES